MVVCKRVAHNNRSALEANMAIQSYEKTKYLFETKLSVYIKWLLSRNQSAGYISGFFFRTGYLACLILLIVFNGSATKADYNDSTWLYQTCRHGNRTECYQYIIGVIDGLSGGGRNTLAALAASNSSSGTSYSDAVKFASKWGIIFCPGPDVTIEDFRRTILAFMERTGGAHPDVPASGSISGALEKAFPCKY